MNSENTLKALAKMHYDEMNKRYKKDTDKAAESMRLILSNKTPDIKDVRTAYERKAVESSICLVPCTASDALFMEKNRKTCILVFSDTKDPCSGFLKGENYQADDICHTSNLKNILDELKEEEENVADENGQTAIYINDVLFIKETEEQNKKYITEKSDILICRPPVFDKTKPVLENRKKLTSGICFIKDIMEKEGTDTAILGAFGCGYAGWDARKVADVFQDAFKITGISKIVYAIPDEKSENHRAFKTRISYSRQQAYDMVNTTQIKLKLNNIYDRDILEQLSKQNNRQGYIKRLIREDIEH